MSTNIPHSSGKLSREEYKKQKDIEAARKAGKIPAEVDEEGNAINPHIPEFMSKAPWYMDTGKVGLQHQRNRNKEEDTDLQQVGWYSRGARVNKAAKKYRKGACENCGAMSHKTKDCMERPRKKGAKWTNKSIMADEVVQDINLSYDAKRDRWNGYDPTGHKKLMEDWDMVEEARRKRKASELDKSTQEAANKAKQSDSAISEHGEDDIIAQLDSSDDEAEDKNEDVEKSATKSKSTVRNLRIREDTAKYLRNLDPDSAYYDPKTRSMRENPYAGKDPTQLAYSGDNFIRYSGEALEVAKREVFAWESSERGNSSAHFQANPTQSALMYKDFTQKKDTLKDSRKQAILSAYGGEEHLQAPPRELLQQQEHYVEYSPAGKVIEGAGRPPNMAKMTKYREDIYPLNHTCVYGSWWSDGKWGYACCKQVLRNSYCTAAVKKK